MNDTKKIEQLAEEAIPFDKDISIHVISDLRLAFVKGYTAALSESKQMKWIRCSERLPEKRRIVILGLIDRNGMTLHGDGYIDEFHGKDQWFLGDHRHDFPVKLTHDVIEWLDESAPQPNQQGCEEFAKGFAEWIRINENYQEFYSGSSVDELLQLYTSPSPQKTQTK